MSAAPQSMRSVNAPSATNVATPAGGGAHPLPPPDLIHAVAGTDDPAWFLESGQRAADAIRASVARHGRRIESMRAILDFGCGSGRVLRHWAPVGGPEIHGSDYNPTLVEWCERNLGFARYQVNTLTPLLGYDDETFDLVYALSVFTHLPEPDQLLWMDELHRVLRPGGLLLLTTHGGFYRPNLLPADLHRFAAGELVVYGDAQPGTNVCATFHPEAYVRRVLARRFHVLEFVPEGALGNPRQDLTLLEKRAEPHAPARAPGGA